jgi:hypothetical protein
MSDYDYCHKHDLSFLVPELLMCPKCAVDAVLRGALPEPIGDALCEAIKELRKDSAWYPDDS